MAPKIVDKDARRQAILAAAAGVFAQHGYRRATIDQVAAAAGVAKGSVYLAFASKEDLFHALFESMFDGMLEEPRDEDDGPALARIERTLCRIADAIADDDKLIPLTLEFWAVCGVGETRKRFGDSYAAMFTGFRGELVRLLAEAEAGGEIGSGLPHEAIASCLIAMIDGLLIQQWTVPGVTVSDTLRASLPAFLGSLRNDPGS